MAAARLLPAGAPICLNTKHAADTHGAAGGAAGPSWSGSGLTWSELERNVLRTRTALDPLGPELTAYAGPQRKSSRR